MRLNPESIARASSRHPWRTVGVWFVIFVLAGCVEPRRCSGRSLTTDFDFTNTPGGQAGQADLGAASLEQDVVTETWVIAGSGEGATQDPAFVQDGERGPRRPQRARARVVTYVPPAFPLPEQAAQDPQTAALRADPVRGRSGGPVHVVIGGRHRQPRPRTSRTSRRIREEATTGDVHAYMLGEATSTEDFKRISEEDLRFGESIGIVAAIIVLHRRVRFARRRRDADRDGYLRDRRDARDRRGDRPAVELHASSSRT